MHPGNIRRHGNRIVKGVVGRSRAFFFVFLGNSVVYNRIAKTNSVVAIRLPNCENRVDADRWGKEISGYFLLPLSHMLTLRRLVS